MGELNGYPLAKFNLFIADAELIIMKEKQHKNIQT
jgi:hypothetical protein